MICVSHSSVGGTCFCRATFMREPNHEETVMPNHASPAKDDIVALEKSYWDAMKKKDGHRAAALSAEIPSSPAHTE
jgi:hypothetical protein